MCCILNSALQSGFASSCCGGQQDQPTKKTIGIIGRVFFEDFKPKGIIKKVAGNSISYNLISENRFMDGQYRNTTFVGLDGIIDLEKMFYSQFKKRKKLSKCKTGHKA
jgi:hypothetical protein